jgi:acetyltransferase-like isoleucine patch superfamily enzyme
MPMDIIEKALGRISGLRVQPSLGSTSDLILEPASDEKLKVTTSRGGRVLCADALTLRRPSKAIAEGRDSLVCIGAGTSLDNVTLQASGNGALLFIGPNCRLKSLTIKVSGADCTVLIGTGTTWESGVVNCDAGRSIVIGDDCMISNDVLMRVSDGHGIWDALTGERLALPGDIQIHSHVWLGNGVRVGKGVEIGTGTVVGQMSLVLGHLEPHCIYAGIPAKLLRRDIEWSRTFSREDIPSAYRLNSSQAP